MAASKVKPITETLGEIHDLLQPHTSEDRQKIIASVMTLLGEAPLKNVPPAAGGGDGSGGGGDDGPSSDLPRAAATWMRQGGITQGELEEVFYIDGKAVEVLASKLPAETKKDGTIQAYLLCGIQQLLQSGTAEFTDADAITYTKHVGVYDKNNHTANRKALGNRVTGSKESGFKLAAPGLREAAKVVKSIADTAT